MERAYKNLSAEKDLKLIINTHFCAYKVIYDIINDMYKKQDKRLVISQESTEIKLKFDDNFRELQEYNKLIGCNNNVNQELHKIRILINNINDNLNSLFGYMQ